MPQPAVSAAARDFLDLFYPVHYKIGIGIEDALRGGRLTRHQVAILWLIRSEGEGGKRIARKEIERSITRWFEIGNSAISKALRVLAKPPYELLAIVENPLSARERYVLLTPAGEQQIEWMVGQGHRFLQRMVDHLNADESAQGVHFLTRVSAIIDIVEREKPVAPAALVTDGLKPRRARR
ncbi:winged helix DNA-binding protein [Nevskia sp.]|uniref:winged helix DNA-binding protein n=1 Tax=Nevskia sp. TaxID=1929292 RepID=UPI0025CEA0AB|nr:winged helix DNA-binding protein [Nevskia sp.]